MSPAAIIIFCLTYLLIASHRLPLLPLGRPAGALLGAVLMIAVGVLSPKESYSAIDHNTLLLLFAMMLLTVYLERAGFFEVLATRMLTACSSPRVLLTMVALLSGLLSAFLVNDTVCLFFTPALVTLCRKARLPLGPYLIALATSANIGSAATLVGNPQNMIIGSLSGMAFREFLFRAGPASLVGLGLNIGLLLLYYGRLLGRGPIEAQEAGGTPDRGLLWRTGLISLGVVVCFFLGLHLGYSTLAGVLVLMILERRDPREIFSRVDWPLLIFFCGLFVVVAGLAKTGLVEIVWTTAAPHLDLGRAQGVAFFSALMTLGSNLVSNVPMVLLTGPHLGELGGRSLGWVMLAFTTTVAGNLTLVGSVANIIVAEGARDHHVLGFWEYLRFGAVSTLLVLFLGVAIIWWQAAWLASG